MELEMHPHEYENDLSDLSSMQTTPFSPTSTSQSQTSRAINANEGDNEGQYQQLGFQTSQGIEWFTLSPATLASCLIESELHLLRTGLVDDIDFASLLDMAAYDFESGQTVGFCAESLLDVINQSVTREIRQRQKIRRVISEMLRGHHGVAKSVVEDTERLLDAEISARGITALPEWKNRVTTKACAIARARLHEPLKRSPRNRSEEFHINLRRIVNGHCENIRKTDLFLPFAMPFSHFLAMLRDETLLSHKPVSEIGGRPGWTLHDGPWKYRFDLTKGQPGDWCDLNSEAGYREILGRLRRGGGVLTMMHGVEVDMILRYHDEERIRLRDGWQNWDEVTDRNGNAVFDSPRAID